MEWDKPLIFKELTEVYIVNHKKFWTRREAEIYAAELEMEEIGRRLSDAKQGSEIYKAGKKKKKRSY